MIKVKQRRFITLIEIMIVMFLITMVLGTMAYNYRGSLDEGRAFKTRHGIEKLETILVLSLADEPEDKWYNIKNTWKSYVEDSPLVSNPREDQVDGWGREYEVSYEDGKIIVFSQRYHDYVEKNKNTKSKP